MGWKGQKGKRKSWYAHKRAGNKAGGKRKKNPNGKKKMIQEGEEKKIKSLFNLTD